MVAPGSSGGWAGGSWRHMGHPAHSQERRAVPDEMETLGKRFLKQVLSGHKTRSRQVSGVTAEDRPLPPGDAL